MRSRNEILNRSTPLALALPGAQFTEGHARIISAGPDRVWAALHALRWSDLRLTLPLMAVRTAGVWFTRQPGPDPDRRLFEPPSPAAPLFEDPPWVSTSGMIGRPWTPVPTIGPEVASLDELREFSEGSWLKFGMEWIVSPIAGERTLVETATLCEATDATALRWFAAYWAVIRGFSGLVRRDMLAALAREVAGSVR